MDATFARIIVLGWYDGLFSGLAWQADGSAFRFELLDMSYPDNDEVRIFSLAPLLAAEFENVVAACSIAEKPQWPGWVPYWQFPSPQAEAAAHAAVQKAADHAGTPDRVLASRGAFDEVMAGPRVTSDGLATVDHWFAYLGLPRLEEPRP